MNSLALSILTLPLIGFGAGVIVGLWLLFSLFLKENLNISVEFTLILPVVVFLLMGANWQDFVELIKEVAIVIVGVLSAISGLCLVAMVSQYIYDFINK